jgi:cysteine-rich repeat protein
LIAAAIRTKAPRAVLRLLAASGPFVLLLACAGSEPIVPGDPGPSGGGGAGGEGGATATSTTTTTTSTTATTSSTTTGAGGAEPDPCGDGVLDDGEECDDANDTTGDGCGGCVVECDGPDESKHPTSFHCFRYFAAPLSWTAARAACQAWGSPVAPAELASIRDDQELANVLDVADVEAWIGLADRDLEGSYVWSDGEPFDYEAWATFQPSDDGDTGEDCVAFRTSGLWDDAPCGVAKGYVCERLPPGG